jgi:hypothetical protein
MSVSMKANIPQAYRTALLQRPLSTPTLIGLEKPEETAVAMRVTDLFSFRRQGIPITTRAIGYQGKEGIWVVAVAFCLARNPAAPFAGVAYVNPRQASDLHLLQCLAKQERLPFLFLSPHLKVTVRQNASWDVHHRQEVRLLLAQIGHLRSVQETAGSMDPDFECARQEFQRLYSVKTLLAVRTQGDARTSSPFRGVVLD